MDTRDAIISFSETPDQYQPAWVLTHISLRNFYLTKSMASHGFLLNDVRPFSQLHIQPEFS